MLAKFPTDKFSRLVFIQFLQGLVERILFKINLVLFLWSLVILLILIISSLDDVLITNVGHSWVFNKARVNTDL